MDIGCSLLDSRVTIREIPACFFSSLMSPTPGLCQRVTCDVPMRAQPSLEISTSMSLTFFLGFPSPSYSPFFASSCCFRDCSWSLVFTKICFCSLSAYFFSYSARFLARASSREGSTATVAAVAINSYSCCASMSLQRSLKAFCITSISSYSLP